jgi:HEAT repeat protein
LQVNPTMLPRLDDIETDLLDRRVRAQAEAWLGEIEGIDLTLQFLRQKRERTRRVAEVAAVDLGMPSLRVGHHRPDGNG